MHPSHHHPALSPPGVLFALARGLGVGGVNVWAMRLARALARGCDGLPPRPVTILAHPEEAAHEPMQGWLWPGVRLVRLTGVPLIDECHGDLSPFVPTYRAEAERLCAITGRPAVLVPGLHGDSFGICAELAQAMPERVRSLGVCHSSIPYDRVVIERYESVLSRIIAVSDEIERSLRAALPARAPHIVNLPHGVEVPPEPPARRAGPGRERPIRLIYTGRMEHGLKRVTALVALSIELDRRGVEHQLVLVGDGPAAADVDQLLADAPSATRSAPVTPARIPALLREADLFVLTSRVEGLSVSMLEAMAQGCVPVCTPTRSGASQLITSGVTGVLADLEDPEGASDDEVARAMADAVERLVHATGDASIGAMSRRAWTLVHQRYTAERQARAFGAIADRVSAEAPRSWPADRPCAFSAPPARAAHAGSVPADAAARMARAMRGLAGRRVAIHGVGAHTLALAAVLAERTELVGFTDDDRARHGQALWGRPIVAPERVSDPAPAGLGASDIIISSWMHERDIWARRRVYESRGVRVHRLYASSDQASGQRVSEISRPS